MLTDRSKALGLGLALKAVLNAATKQGLDVDELSEAAVDELLRYKAYDSAYVPMAINELEAAVDALDHDDPPAG